MNNWAFTGNLGRDAELKQVGQSTLCSFSVAVKAGYGDRASTVWVRCALWGKRADALAPHLLKGTTVAVCGELSENEWQTQGGENKKSLEVRVTDVTLVGKPRQSTAPQQQTPAPGQPAPTEFEDDIPF